MKNFNDIVGQHSLKTKLSFYLENYKRTKRIPHFLFVGGRGTGKTAIATFVAQRLNKDFIVLNCSTLKGVEDFFNKVIKKHTLDYKRGYEGFFGFTPKPYTIIFDEASELSKELTMALLTILNPTTEHKNNFVFEGKEYVFDFSVYSFIFATTEPQDIFHALVDRCERIDLESYTIEDLAKIVQKNVSVKIKPQTLLHIASVLRSNPRAAQKMADNINSEVQTKGLQEFGDENWKVLQRILSILPLGINNTELQILQVLNKEQTIKLHQLSARLGLTATSVQRHFEQFLIKNDLIEIKDNGRSLTQIGKDYINSL